MSKVSPFHVSLLEMQISFLRNAEGEFDYPALLICLFLLLCLVGVVLGLARACRTGKILFSWCPDYGDLVEFYVNRKSRPVLFWLLFIIYCCFGVPLLAALFIGICFGLFRKL
jgi:hypothetical protein